MFPAVDAIFVLIPRENHMYLQNCSTSTHGVWPSTVARGKAVGRGRHRWDGDFPFNRPSPVSGNDLHRQTDSDVLQRIEIFRPYSGCLDTDRSEERRVGK